MAILLKQTSLLVLGDSITKGMIQEGSKSKYRLLKDNFMQILADKFSVEQMNWSVFGATIDKGMQILKRKMKRMPHRTTTFLEFGGNDCNFDWAKIAEHPELNHEPMTELNRFEARYRELIQELKRRSERLYLLTLPPLDADRFFQTVSRGLNKDNIMKYIGGKTRSIYRWQESYSNRVLKLGHKENVPVIDIRESFLLERNYENFLCEDGMHPNERGHQLIADVLARYFSN